jgi:hypothetical protein
LPPGIVLEKSAKVKVGLFACSTSKDKFRVTYDRFQLTPSSPSDPGTAPGAATRDAVPFVGGRVLRSVNVHNVWVA